MFATSLAAGDSDWGDLKFALGIATALSSVVAFPFFFAITFVRNRFFPEPESPDYKPGYRFFAIVATLLLASVSAGVNRMQAVIAQKQLTAQAQEQRVARARLGGEQKKAAAEDAALKAATARKAATMQPR